MFQNPLATDVLHLELTSQCPLLCQQCARTDFKNKKAIHSLPLESMSLDTLDNILHQFSNITALHVCGNYGDIMTYPLMEEALDIINNHNIPETRLYSNGSGRNTTWWKYIGTHLKGTLTFSIDGLADTNHIYRVNSRWGKVMSSAEAFINAGGKAIWEMLAFRHNEHQIDKCKQLSEEMGFESFRVKRPSRFTVYDTQGNVEPAIQKEYQHKNKDVVGQQQKIICKYKQQRWIYVSFEGDLFPCCWMGGQKYKMNQDNNEIYQLFKKYGKDFLSLKRYTAQEIFEHPWFKNELEKSWNTSPYKVCTKQCLESLNNHQELQYVSS